MDNKKGEPVARGYYDPGCPVALRICETDPDIKIQKLNLNQEHQSPEIPSQFCQSDRDSEKLDHCEPKLVHTGLNPEPEYDECRSDLQSPLIENHFFPSKPEN